VAAGGGLLLGNLDGGLGALQREREEREKEEEKGGGKV
jgi:hypothetical protein